MTKTERQLLNHLTPMTDYSDTYLCGIYFKNKNHFTDSVYDKVAAWVTAHGGTIRKINDKVVMVGETKGYMVKIIFPSYNPAKQAMQELYNGNTRYSHNVLISEQYGIHKEHSRYVPATI